MENVSKKLDNMYQQSTQHLQEHNNSPSLTKIIFLLMAFGISGYIWVKISQALAVEIEKR